MEGAPKHINTKTMRDSLLNNIPQLLDVHDIHLWSLSENYIIVTLHAVIKPAADNYQVLFLAKKMLKDTFAISHSTIELEYETGKCIDEALGIETITK